MKTRRRRLKRILISIVLLSAIGAAATYAALHKPAPTPAPAKADLPTTRVKKGQVTISVSARGELQGGNSETLVAPMAGVDTLTITKLCDPGQTVAAGDTVVEFDTTQQEYNLREAQADQAEAEQQVIQAQATSDATQEETHMAYLQAQSDLKLAELECRRNPLLPAIVARQNDIAVEAAKNRLHQAEQDLINKKANAEAGIVIQQAALNKAKVTVATNQKIIESMTLKAKTGGYVNILPNTFSAGIIFWGMQLLPFQLGDTARAGMAVAQIPDMKNWEVSANVGELDRGHLSPGQKVTVAVVALAGKSFAGHVKSIGGTAGNPWDRHFETRIALDQPGPELRPGMTSNLVITVETIDDATWVPSQALFDSDGRNFVYLQTPRGFMPHDVTLLRRSESQAVIKGVNEGDTVAMSNPDQQTKSATDQTGAMGALQK
jgi:multidrug efflux pump subunit AcrA (membrane-fusion protein)